jgi:hypothetical protein
LVISVPFVFCFIADHRKWNPALCQNPLNLIKEVVDQRSGVFERVGPSRVFLRPVPMVDSRRSFLEPGSRHRDGMGVVKPDQPCAIRIVERERVPQAMWPPPCPACPLDLEFRAIAAFVPMAAAIKGKEKFECMFITTPHLPYHDRIDVQPSSKW